jgi:uncharacterized membrane protein YhhN
MTAGRPEPTTSAAGAPGQRGHLATVAIAAFAVVSVLHLAGQLGSADSLSLATKPLLMPALLWWFVTATSAGRLRTVVAIGLGWSWLGDLGLMPSGDGWFLAGLGAFLVAQLTYAVAFWPSRHDSILAKPVLVLPYVLALVGLLAILWDDLGDLRLPIIAYAIVIIVMAILATGLGPVVATGAILFVISDSLIALHSVTGTLRLPGHGFWVMLTYLAAQALIVAGVHRRARAAARTPAAP